MVGVSAEARRPRQSPPRSWDRFAAWPRGAAGAALAAIALAMLLAIVTAPVNRPVTSQVAAPSAGAVQRDTDLKLYDAIAERVAAGENYYRSAIAEQRARDFPVRPGLAVRLPTLAHLTAALGSGGMAVLAGLLGLTVAAAWWLRLGIEPGGRDRRPVAIALLAVGTLLGLKPQYLVLHEVWAGLLLALALALHRPGKWRAAWLAAAAAVAVREHALPFVLLMGALAAWRRRWPETAAWAGLAALFGLGLCWHLAQVDALLLPSDRPSPPWLVLRGLRGLTGNLIDSSILQLLPPRLGGPLALLPLIGWAGWKSDLAQTAALLFAGYGLLFMVAGRDNNFYWALMVTPAWFVGLAQTPMALRGLIGAASARRS